ncbi:MAG: tRNA-binding protein [Caldisericaceae bacterium]
MEITYQDFEKVEVRVGRILEASFFKEALKPAYKLVIDFGELGIKKSSAQITQNYKIEDLVGREIIAVVNFPPKQIANFVSEVLVLGVNDNDGNVVLLAPDRVVSLGKRMY